MRRTDRDARVLLAVGLLLAAGLILFETFDGRELTPDPVQAGSETGTSEQAAGTGALTERDMGVPVNLNTATEEALTLLPGIGPAKAAAILAYRKENGPFRTVDELCNVSGIGEKTLERLRGSVTVE